MASLAAGDLNDFLAPSQECILPVSQTNKLEPSLASTDIQIDATDGSYFEVSQTSSRKLDKAQITLNDCLACSGCITSAESVLVSMQSHEEVYRVLQDQPDLIPVASISPQSIASLATAFSLSTSTCLDRLRTFFTQHLGFHAVFDTTFARSLSLEQTQLEYVERRAAAKTPILASACPGWVCYAEKTQHELLPLLSAVKSPQAIMGSIVKDWYAPRFLPGRARDQIYHVTVMPCYDKKLEASRPDFADADGVRDVDCVLTTGEVLKMLQDKGMDLSLAADLPPSQAVNGGGPAIFPELMPHAGSSSGSYLYSVIADLVQTTAPANIPLLKFDVKPIRGTDYVDYTLRLAHPDKPQILFKGAVCYGFRNLQNLVRKVGKERGLAPGRAHLAAVRRGVVRRRKGDVATPEAAPDRAYDYVEVMACPSGCVNGGGQLPPQASAVLDAEGLPRAASDLLPGQAWVLAVERKYWEAAPGWPGADPSVQPFLDFNKAASDLRQRIRRDLGGDGVWRTGYRPVVSEEVSGLAVKW